MFLLSSHDAEVQRAASAALGNLAVNSKLGRFLLGYLYSVLAADNKLLIVKLGGLEPLIRQMLSPNVEVQCNAVGCVTNLATHGDSIYAMDLQMRVDFISRRQQVQDCQVWCFGTPYSLGTFERHACAEKCDRRATEHDTLRSVLLTILLYGVNQHLWHQMRIGSS